MGGKLTTKQQQQQQLQINIATYKLVDDDVPTFSLPALKKAIVNHYWANFSHLLLLISTNYV